MNRTLSIGPNHSPVCSDVPVTIAPRATAAAKPTTFALSCSDEDNDQLTLVVDHAPAHGQLTQLPLQARVTYAPEVGYTGQDVATFRVTDANGGTSAQRRLKLGVGEPPADDPVAPPRGAVPSSVAPPASGASPSRPPKTPSLASRAAEALGTRGKRLDLGLGTAAQAFAAVAPKGIKVGAPLIAVFCPQRCTLRAEGRITLGHGAKSLRLARRVVKVSAARPGVVRLALNKAQRARVAHVGHASVTLTLRTTASGKATTIRRRFAIRRTAVQDRVNDPERKFRLPGARVTDFPRRRA